MENLSKFVAQGSSLSFFVDLWAQTDESNLRYYELLYNSFV